MSANTEPTAQDPTIEHCELCVIGAGIAGLNALFVATQYLSKNDKVVLIDDKPKPGGMWTETYDYVRLHQPHRMFTAGNIAWGLGEKPAYLAAKNEVLDQFDHCLDDFRDKLQLVEYYEHRYLSHREIELDGRMLTEITIRAENPERAPRIIRATRCIKAAGFNVRVNKPLSFSSTLVKSISPHDKELFGAALGESQTPIVIVGGGKTAMDTAHNFIAQFPAKEIIMLAGKGTVFGNRDTNFPGGFGRLWSAPTSLEAFLEICSRYDGDNNAEVFKYFKKIRTVSLDDQCQQFMFGLLSEHENATIKDGLNAYVLDYLDDIEDVDGEPQLVLRSGERRALAQGSWIVNCTGYINQAPIPYEPFISAHGTVASIQATSTIHFLTTFASYFLSHLFFLGKAQNLPLYEVDYQDLLKKNKNAMPIIAMTHLLYNVLIIVDAVPSKVMIDCGLDFDRWFPTYRRMIAAVKLRRDRDQYVATFKQALDRSREVYGIRCGPLAHSTNSAAA